MVRLGSSYTFCFLPSHTTSPSPHTHTQIYSVFQVRFLQNSTTVTENTTANNSLEIQILIAPFAILQSQITVTLSIPTDSSTDAGTVIG